MNRQASLKIDPIYIKKSQLKFDVSTHGNISVSFEISSKNSLSHTRETVSVGGHVDVKIHQESVELSQGWLHFQASRRHCRVDVFFLVLSPSIAIWKIELSAFFSAFCVHRPELSGSVLNWNQNLIIWVRSSLSLSNKKFVLMSKKKVFR